MTSNVLALLVLVLSVITTVESCAYNFLNKVQETKFAATRKTTYKRKLYTEDPQTEVPKCVCGQETEDAKKPWNVYVVVDNPETETGRACFGTVIAHNLVVTSHKCLILDRKTMRPYDAWDPPPKFREQNMASPENVRVENFYSEKFKSSRIKKIIYNVRYSEYAAVKDDGASMNDLAIIVVHGNLFMIFNRFNEDFTSSETVRFSLPVCIPQLDRETDFLKPFVHKYGYYYGTGKDAGTPEIKLINKLVIMAGEACDKEQNLSNFSTNGILCTKTAADSLPDMEGGPLLTTNHSGYLIAPDLGTGGQALPFPPQTTFLVGLSTVAKKLAKGKPNVGYTYFVNVLQNLEFIEKVADAEGTMWCDGPAFVETKKAQPDELKLKEVHGERLIPIPGDDLGILSVKPVPIKEKNPRKIYAKTLPSDPTKQCVCGQEESLSERPWDVIVNVTLKKSKSTRQCTGTIIAHNLVITSHKCLSITLKNNKVVQAKDVMIVTVEFDGFFNVRVKKIRYNRDYLMFANEASVSESDTALIVVEDDFFKIVEKKEHIFSNKTSPKYWHLPACVPHTFRSNRSKAPDLTHRFGYYHGIGGDYSGATTMERRRANELVIMNGRECDKEQNLGWFSSSANLCTRTVLDPLPSMEGGPLMTTNQKGFLVDPRDEPGQTAFLVGISTFARKFVRGKRITYTYYTNILENLDFIEKEARDQHSLFCQTPVFTETKRSASPEQWKLETWPWETEPIPPRSETLECACGFKNSKAAGRIAGGEDAIPYEFGWMVKTTSSNPSEGLSNQCAASIINDRVLLTAAHCLVKEKDKGNGNDMPFEPVSQYTVYIGSHYFYDDSIELLVTVKKTILHPAYLRNKKLGTNAFDLGLVILEEPIKFAKATSQATTEEIDIRPICLSKTSKIHHIPLNNGTKLTAIGWGILNPWDHENAEYPEELQKVQVTVRDMGYCAEKYFLAIPDTVFCVADFIKKHGSTHGDSGGPIAFQKSNSKFFQVGVTSFSKDISPGTGTNELVNYYTDVQQFIPFIEYYSNLYGAKWCKK